MIKISFNILYYHKNVIRKKYLEEQMASYEINPNWIKDYDKEELTELQHSKINKDHDKIFHAIKEFIPGNIIEEFLKEGMNDAEVSLNIKHVESMRRFLEQFSENDYYVVLEDDAILSDNFKDKFVSCFKKLPKNFNLFHFDWGNLTPKIDPLHLEDLQNQTADVQVFENNLPAKFQLGSAGFCMSHVWCRRVVDYYDQNGFSVPSDWQLSSIFFHENNSKCFTCMPKLIKQGSFDTYGSSVRDRVNGVFK